MSSTLSYSKGSSNSTACKRCGGINCLVAEGYLVVCVLCGFENEDNTPVPPTWRKLMAQKVKAYLATAKKIPEEMDE